MAELPRGIRNNNPGNIVLSDIPWLGKVAGDDSRFETFESAEAGLRALSLNLLNYARKHDLSSVKDIISRFAPSTENDTGSYIRSVANRLGVDPNTRLNLEDPGILAQLSEAVVSHENGMNPYKTDQYLMAATSARDKTEPATPITNAPSAKVTAPPEQVPLDQASRLSKLTGLSQEQIAKLPLTTQVTEQVEVQPEVTNESRLAKYAQYLMQHKDQMETPEFQTVARAYQALRGTQPTQQPEAETPKEKAGFFSTLKDSASTLLAAPETISFGGKDNEETRKALLKARETEHETTPLSEVSNVGDFVDWLKQQGGAMAGYLAAPGAAAQAAKFLTRIPGVSRAVGYGVLGAQYAIDNLTRTAQEQQAQVDRGEAPTPVDLTKTLVAATAQTALDVAGFEFFKPMFGRFPILKNLVGEEAGQTAKQTEQMLVDAFEKGNLTASRGIITGIGEGVAFEMPQEIAQQALERWQSGLSLTDKDARDEYIEAGAAALIFGGALGGTSKVLENAGKRAEAEDILRKRAADKIKESQPEKTVVETTATQTPGERTEAPGPEGEPGVTQLLGEYTPGAKAPDTGIAPATPAKVLKGGPSVREWESMSEEDLTELRNKAAEAGVPTSMMQEFETRLGEIRAARSDPKANKFKLNAQVQKNGKIFRQIQEIIAEPAPGVPYSAPKTVTTAAAAAAPTTTQPSTYQRQTQTGVSVPPGTAASLLGGVGATTGSDTGTQPGTTGAGAKVSVPKKGTGEKPKAPATGGLEGAGTRTGVPTGGEETGAAALDVAKEIKRAYLELTGNLSEVEKEIVKKPEEVDLEGAEAERRKAPVTKKELAAIPTDPDKLLELAKSALEKDPFNLTRVQNGIKTAKARAGFDPKTDLEGIRQILAKAMRKLPTVKAEGGYKETIKSLRAQIKAAEKLESNPETRAQGEKARADIHKALAKMRAYYKLPTRQLYAVKTAVVDTNPRRTEAIKIEQAIKGKSIEEIADALVDLAPNKFSKYIAEKVRDTIRNYLKAGFEIDLTIIDKDLASTSTDPEVQDFIKSSAVGRHSMEPFKKRSEVRLRGTDMPLRGHYGTEFETVMHEIIHAITSRAVYLTKAPPGSKIFKAQQDLKKLYNDVLRYHNARKGLPLSALHSIERMIKFGSNALETERELIAWTMTNKDMQEYMESIPYKGKTSMWDRFVQIVRDLLGLNSSADTALSELLRITGELFDDSVVRDVGRIADLQNTVYLATKSRLESDKRTVNEAQRRVTAEPATPETPAEIEARLAKEVREKTGQNYGIKEAVKQKFTYRNSEELIRLFQNERRPLKRLQDALLDAGKLIIGAENFNNIYDQIMLSSGKAFHLMTRDIQPHIVEMQRAIQDYAQAANLDINSALGRLHMYMMALHEPERRLVKYLKNVPLDNKTKLNVGGKEMTPADIRDAIFRELTKDVDLTKKGPDGKSAADKLRARLQEIVAQYKDPNGFSPVGFKSIDLNSKDYTVVGGYSKEQIDAMRDQYNNDPHQKELSAMIKAMKELQANTIKLDKMANYWSQPTTNLTAFYDYKNYVPFKGKPKSEVTKGDESLELGYSRVSSKDFNEFAYGTEGRLSDSDNPLIQTMVDGAKAATRAGREGVTQSLKNLINQKYIRGKLFKKITFEQRFNGFDPEEISGKNMYFHYMPDGTIEVYEIFDVDKPISEAIRRTFRANSPILDAANSLTSLVGAFHTRYNPAFHPYNFVRDVLTNTWTVAAEKGGKAAYDFIGSVARQVADGGFYKAGKVSSLYSEGKIDEIKSMAYNPDGSVKDQGVVNVLEYLEEGGRVSYVMGMAMKGQVESMLKEVGRSKIIQTKDQLNTYVDVWTDAFEFTSRAAAYASMKSNYMAEATKRFKDRAGRAPTKAEADVIEKGARQRAAAYAKELANFEQIGVYGREAGAMFMFFRPAATGAVRALDALRPAFETFEQAASHLPSALQNDPEALAEFKRTYEERRKTAIDTITALAAAGAFAYMMAVMAAGDDDQGRNRVLTDDMDIWTRNLRLPVKFLNPIFGKDNDFFNVPWGFGAGSFAAMGAQFMGAAMGGNSLGNAIANSASITLDSFLPIPVARFNPTDNPLAWIVDSAMPSILRPAVEYVMNVDTFGKQIYNSRVSRYGDAYSGGEYVPESYKKVTRFLAEISNGAINWQPQTVAFFMSNYADGMSRLLTNMHGLEMTVAGNKDFDLKRDITVFDSFIGKKSSVDARQFAEVEKKVKDMRDTINMFKNRPDGGEALSNYIKAHPDAPILVNYYNQVVNGPMRDAREQLNKMTGSDLPPNQRRPTVDMLRTVRDTYAKSFVDLAKTYGVEPN